MSVTATRARPVEATGFGSLFSSMSISYLLAFASLAGLVWAGGLWNLLANTRLLDVLIRSGVIALTDADAGLIHGVPEAHYYIAATDNVDLGLLLFAATSLFLGAWLLRGVQFHAIVTYLQGEGSFRTHLRAFLYGSGVDRVLPYDLGVTATAVALEGHGHDPADAARAAYLPRVLGLVEIAFLLLVGMALSGWTTMLGSLFWALVILLAAHLVTRDASSETRLLAWSRASLGVLAQDPSRFARLVGLSLAAAMLEPLAAYVVSQSFTSANVILNIDLGVLVLGVACANVARLVKVTPGGIGQGEWAFATALYVSGVGMPEAVTVAILYSFVRYVIDVIVLGRYIVGTLVLGSSVTFGFGVQAGLRQVLGAAMAGTGTSASTADPPSRPRRKTTATKARATSKTSATPRGARTKKKAGGR